MQAENDKKIQYPDIFDKCSKFDIVKKVKAAGYYPYFHPIDSAPGDEVVVDVPSGRMTWFIAEISY